MLREPFIVKVRQVRVPGDCHLIIREARKSAQQAIFQLEAAFRQGSGDALETLWHMKTRMLGADPLDSERPLNIIEQLNQSFTCVASAMAGLELLRLHPDLSPFTLNLGTAKGFDIWSDSGPGLRAEVFAAVSPANNQKLRADIDRLKPEPAVHKYVFFMCPGIPAGHDVRRSRDGVIAWSLGEQPVGAKDEG